MATTRIKRLMRAVRAAYRAYYEFKDRLHNVDVYRKYGTRDWASRHPRTSHDVEAPKVNANVYIATRAISDAIKSLPVNIVSMEVTDGVERQVDDNDHEANRIVQTPNPEHSWSDIVDHIVKSYLNDGNALLTIEKQTGPNGNVEIWPRDPRNIDISRDKKVYKFGKFTIHARTYRRNQVIHIRDIQVDDPFWGVGRVTTIREEIMMDHFINRFNSRFFENGATLNLMFTPDHDLSDDQHEQILDAMSGEIGGAERAFKLFINKYAGKFEWPEQRHKDLAFGDLLRMNREKTFGVYGLPPFRGGVMEYANYANAIAQDLDFWLNTVKPIIKVIEDGLNKQLIWPIYGPDVNIKFDLDSVPAIRGDDGERVETLIKLKNAGVVSSEYVREQLAIPEDAAPDEPEDDGDDNGDPPADKSDPKTEDKRQQVANALYTLFKMQREVVFTNLQKMTGGGVVMTTLIDPDGQSARAFPQTDFSRRSMNTVLPLLKEMTDAHGVEAFKKTPILYDSRLHETEIEELLHLASVDIELAVEQMGNTLRDIMGDTDRFTMGFRRMEKCVRGLFSAKRADDIATALVYDHGVRTGQWVEKTINGLLSFTVSN